MLSKINVEEGATVPIGTAIATIGEEVAEDGAAKAPAAARRRKRQPSQKQPLHPNL